MGGRYTPHFDSGGWEDRPVPEEMKVYINQAKGERIGTFMAYLSDVDIGGGTGSKPQRVLVNRAYVDTGGGAWGVLRPPP